MNIYKKNLLSSLLFVLFCFIWSGVKGISIKYAKIDFYGDTLVIPYDSMFLKSYYNSVAPASFNLYFEKCNKLNHQVTITRLKEIKEKYRLDDFGYLVLLKKMVTIVFSGKPENSRNLFIWFMMLKSDYDVFLGYSDIYVVVMAKHDVPLATGGSIQLMSDGSYRININFNGDTTQKYISHSFTIFKHYMNLRKTKLKSLVFNYNELPKLPVENVKRKIELIYHDSLYVFNYVINKRLMAYYDDLPFFVVSRDQVKMGFSVDIKNTLVKQLKEILAGINNREAELNFLLFFVQESFKFREDKGIEKHNFPEETLYYEFSDCDDRAALFASLIKEIYNMNSILLDYPNHVNVGIHYYENDKGWKYILYLDKGGLYLDMEKYTICDPTGEGLLIGQDNYGSQPIEIRELW